MVRERWDKEIALHIFIYLFSILGGMAINLIRKHGLVPKGVYPESVSSSATMLMNRNLKNILRTVACELRGLLASEASLDTVRKHKQERLGDIWRLLCIHLGTPPVAFKWAWTDKDNKQHRANSGERILHRKNSVHSLPLGILIHFLLFLRQRCQIVKLLRLLKILLWLPQHLPTTRSMCV